MKTRMTFATATAIGLALAGQAYAGSNELFLTQTGNSQTATVTQNGGTGDRVGNWNSPFIQQNGAGTYGHNVLVINQNSASLTTGLPNLGAFMSASGNNVVTGYQSGSLNSAEIDQGGYNSSVNLQQDGKGNGPVAAAPWYNGSVGNLILQDQSSNSSWVDLRQVSDINANHGNVFNIGQGGYNNSITGNQTGYNDLWIRQGTTGPDLWDWTYGNYFSPGNVANSLGYLSNSSIKVNQSVGGDAQVNYAALGQGSGSGDAITVNQYGGSNAVDANQVGSANIFVSTQSSADGNTSWNFIGGEAGWPDVSVNPLTGRAGDYRPILQQGNGNEYYATQTGTNLMTFGEQIGNYNYLTSTQSGNLNKLFSRQTGDSNEIYSTQSGDQNTTIVSQNLNNNVSNTVQSGTLNMATIIQ